jgi:hypothetical protein
MGAKIIVEWWRGKRGRGWWHTKAGNGRIVDTGGQSYSRARDAKRAAERRARREGGIVRERVLALVMFALAFVLPLAGCSAPTAAPTSTITSTALVAPQQPPAAIASLHLAHLDVFGQAGQHSGTATHAGWNPMPDIHGGVWLYETSFTFWNASPGAGEIYLSRIEATFDGPVQGVLPRSNWHVDPTRPNVLVIGNGHEYIEPRGSRRVRWSYSNRCPTTVMYGGVQLKFAPSQKRDIFHALAATLPSARDTGAWAPFGDRQPDTPGGQGIGSLGGWEQDAAGFLLRADLVMERMAIGRLDQQTGQPIRTVDHDYTTVRGYGKTTQLDEFTKPPASIWDDSRAPLVTWAGTCAYRDLMLGVNRGTCFLPYDAQHLCRALVPLKAAVQCGDPSARFDLDMVAADCQAARMDTTALPNGSRGLGWTIDAFAHSRPTFGLARTLAKREADAQTVSGAILRAPYGYSFSPSPWAVSETIQNPMPLNMDADAVLERAISCHAGALDSHLETIKRALAGMPWPSRKFLGVGENQTTIYPEYQHPCGGGTWEIHMAIGAAAALDPHGTWWQTYALTEPTPGGKRATSLVNLRDILRAEQVGMDATAVLRCVLESLPL